MDTLGLYLKKNRELVNRELNRLLPKASTKPQTLHRAMRYSVFSGGKRLRPIMAMEACRICGGDVKNVIKAACGLEMIHTYSLIHDDLPAMDNDDYRRGKLSCHKKFGEATAILSGDALLSQAFCALASSEVDGRLKEAIKDVSCAIGSLGMVGGQEIDLIKKDTINLKTEDLRFIAETKTAALFKASMNIGAIFSNAGKREKSALSKFGNTFGVAFQLADDSFDNDGYTRIIGRDKTWARAKELMEKAKRELRIFGEKAHRLKELSDFIVNRTNHEETVK